MVVSLSNLDYALCLLTKHSCRCNPTTKLAVGGRSSCPFMVTGVSKSHHMIGQSKIVLAAKKNMLSTVLSTNESAFKFNTTAWIFKLGWMSTNSRVWKSVAIKSVATRSENSNEIVSVTSYLRKTIVTIAFVNDFVQGGRVELYRLVALYCCILIG